MIASHCFVWRRYFERKRNRLPLETILSFDVGWMVTYEQPHAVDLRGGAWGCVTREVRTAGPRVQHVPG